MPAVEVSVAAATAVVDYNLLGNSPHRQSSAPRRLRAVALCGSAAAGDTRIAVSVNQREIAAIFNSTTGFPTRDHLKGVGENIPPNAEISAIVTDAPATNPLNLLLEFD